MNDKNRVKAGALNKLKNYVECEIRRLRDGGLSLEHFEYSLHLIIIQKKKLLKFPLLQNV